MTSRKSSIVAQCRIDIAVAADRISAVAFAFRAFKQGHQVQIGQAQLLEIRNFGFQALQIACEQIDVAHAANLFVGQNPVRIVFSLRYQYSFKDALRWE